jgi:hypothetical protein
MTLGRSGTYVAMIALGVLAVGVAPAAAATQQLGNYTVVDSSITSVAKGADAQATATCPAGTRPIGGGSTLWSNGATFDPRLGRIMQSRPTANGWLARYRYTGDDVRSFQAVVICASGVANYETQTTTHTVAAGARAGWSISCSGGKQLLSGGFSGPDGAWATSSGPSADAWYTAVRNTTAATATITSYAVCGTGVANLSTVTGAPITIDPTHGLAKATCPAGTQVLSGGVIADPGAAVIGSQPSYLTAGEWDAAVGAEEPTTVVATGAVRCGN